MLTAPSTASWTSSRVGCLGGAGDFFSIDLLLGGVACVREVALVPHHCPRSWQNMATEAVSCWRCCGCRCGCLVWWGSRGGWNGGRLTWQGATNRSRVFVFFPLCPTTRVGPPGFGVLFDTFVNTEAQNAHKDVALLINNDQKLPDAFSTVNHGCDGDFRFWEGRDDFSVLNRSAVKISYNVRCCRECLLCGCWGEWRSWFAPVSCTLCRGFPA